MQPHRFAGQPAVTSALIFSVEIIVMIPEYLEEQFRSEPSAVHPQQYTLRLSTVERIPTGYGSFMVQSLGHGPSSGAEKVY